MKIKELLIDNVLTRIVFKKMLPYMPREILQTYMGLESLSPIEQFAARGYNDLLYSKLNLGSKDSALVLGGYLGDSVSKFRELYNCSVVTVEPVPEYANVLRDAFQSDSKVQVLEFAVSSFNGNLELGLEGESTGNHSDSKKTLEVSVKDISELLVELDLYPKVIEMNIEGGEYECLRRLIETGALDRIQVLLVQFHRYGIENEVMKAEIQLKLQKTHTCIFEFPFVWERWDRKA